MRILRARIQNFRSIEEVVLEDLEPAVVLYGPNGGGKSNILRGIELGLRLVGTLAGGGFPTGAARSFSELGITSDDLRAGCDAGRIELRLAAPWLDPSRQGSFEAAFELDARAGVVLAGVVCSGMDEAPRKEQGYTRGRGDDAPLVSFYPRIRQELERGFRVKEVRAFDHRPTHGTTNAAFGLSVLQLLAAGRVEEAISRAATSDSDELRDAYARLRALIVQPPLSLPDIEAVVPNNEYRLRVQAIRGKARPTLPATHASLGEQQILIVLASILFSGARICAVEEPEAHLHAPTSGRALREVLSKLLTGSADSPAALDQLFIATHSNLFDLDPTGFVSVQRVNERTVATRVNELSAIDEDHLFEPGPAKHILQDMLRHGDGGRVVAYGAGGRAITAKQMQEELQSDTEDAVRYARALSRAAARQFVQKPVDLRAKP
jgi:predicted ATPase